MNPLVKKEIRLLLPAWIAAMLLAVAPVWIFWKLDRGDMRDLPLLPAAIFLLGILFLGIAPFGQEFSFKTFSNSLAQPIPRRRLWLAKTGVLAVAFLSLLAAGLLSWTVCPWHTVGLEDALADNFKVAALGTMAFLSGGLWTALLFRQVTAAFWFTLLTPVVLSFWVGELADHYQLHGGISVAVLAVVLGLYSVAGFFLARLLFFRAQDTQWTGGNILFLRRRKSPGHSGAIIPGGLKNRFVALVWKEIQLHEVNLLIGVILFVLHMVTLLARSIVSNPNFKMAFDEYWSLWLLMPIFIGSAAVAEERKLSTLEAQLCLPVSRTAQFSFKFFTGLILSLLLGAAVPSIIEHTHLFGPKQFLDYGIFIYATAAFFFSFYASTLARSTLQAIGMAIGIPVVVWAGLLIVVTLAFQHNSFDGYQGAGWIALAGVIGAPALPLILARLMFWNFKWLHRDWKLWGCNAVIILTSIVSICLLASAIYYRSWELLTPADYPHGPARLNDSQSIKFSSYGSRISAVLPDGRLWVKTLWVDKSVFGIWETITPDPSKGQFISGSNWTDVASSWPESLAIQSNGSLWDAHIRWAPPNAWFQSAFTRIGSETNWLRVAGNGGWGGFLLLKTDGSLWIWGTNRANASIQEQKLNFQTPPARFSSETNWIDLFSVGNVAHAKKNDGSIWSWKWAWNGTDDIYQFVQNTNTDVLWENLNQMAIGIGTNDEMWVASRQWENHEYVLQNKLQLGQNMKWKAASLSSSEGAVIALRSDGTLWKWSHLWQADFDPSKIRATQLGNHSDWIALPDSWQGTALAADGSLWCWGLRDRTWLAPSRKPIYLGNVFGKSD